MKEHILLEKAHTYDNVRKSLKPEGCTYQSQEGYWTLNSNGQVMMKSDDPKKPKPATKKWDVETGEDQKGE